MTLDGNYMGMSLSLDDLDQENIEYFKFCALGEFRLQRGAQSGLLRYPPTTACPWTGDREASWDIVEGKGTVHAYTEVHHAIQPAYKAVVPYMVLLVELDTQRGEPTEHEALRVVGNLMTPEGEFAPVEQIQTVGIGTRVRMIFTQINDDLGIPNWVVDDTVEQPSNPWRYPT